jgi:hypothetical protein
VKILLDASTPATLSRFLRGHTVTRARLMGWAALENGKLLDATEEAGFDLLITCDQNIRYQQNFKDRKLAVLILSTNHWPAIRQVAARVAIAVDFVQAGSITLLEIEKL